MKLSPNFSLEELTFSQVASRRGLNNTPSDKVKDNLERLAFFLEQIRKLFNKPLLISSGYRSREVNEAVGGSKTSQHCEGCAADFNVGSSLSKCCCINDNVITFKFFTGISDSTSPIVIIKPKLWLGNLMTFPNNNYFIHCYFP